MERVRLLVIDDSATVRAMVEQIVDCDKECHVIGVAADVPTARRLLLDLCPNLITLDLNMPGIDGLTFLDELSRQPHAPIIVLSSNTDAGGAETKEAISRGADACFDKRRVIAEAPRFRRLLKSVVERRARRLARPD
jgi:two-component system chemotaxis response regulator CheB